MKNILTLAFLLTLNFILTPVIKSQNVDNIKRIVKELSSEKYHGRAYTNNGANKAAEYIKKEFEKSGLQSINDEYYQPFSFKLNQIEKVSLKIDTKTLVPGEEYVVRRSSPSISGKWKILKVNPEDFRDLEKMEKIVSNDLSELFIAFDFDDYMNNYAKYDSTAKILFKSAATKFIMLHENELKDYVGFGRKPSKKSIINIRKSAFPADAHEIEFTIKTSFNEISTKNVMGYIPGRTYKDSIIVICGHYDHLGEMGPDTYFPGADDNASAIATMIELANYMISFNPPEKSLLFVAFSAEEAGLLGSKHFVNNLPFEKSLINFALNIDMIGFGDEGIQIWNGLNEPRIANLFKKINNENQLLDTLILQKNTPLSDHYSFTQVDINALFFTTGVEPSLYYHTIKDTYANTPLTKVDKIIQLISKAINSDKQKEIN
jgi:aminopeptidase YwaD